MKTHHLELRLPLQPRNGRRSNGAQEEGFLQQFEDMLRAGGFEQMRPGSGADEAHTQFATCFEVPDTVPNIDDIGQGPAGAPCGELDVLRAAGTIGRRRHGVTGSLRQAFTSGQGTAPALTASSRSRSDSTRTGTRSSRSVATR